MDRSSAAKSRTLTVGARVFYPGHGVTRVVGMEERAFGGDMQVYYVLELENDRGTKLMLPVGKVAQAGIRDLISAAKARALLKEFAQEAAPTDVKSDPAARKLRAAGYGEALRSGSADRYTLAVRELLYRFRAGKLSPGEQQTFQQALAMFVGEISAALHRSLEDIRAELRSVAQLPATGW